MPFREEKREVAQLTIYEFPKEMPSFTKHSSKEFKPVPPLLYRKRSGSMSSQRSLSPCSSRDESFNSIPDDIIMGLRETMKQTLEKEGITGNKMN